MYRIVLLFVAALVVGVFAGDVRSAAAPTERPVYRSEATAPKPTARITTASVTSTTDNQLSIPSIGLFAPIIPVGLTAGNAIDVPADKQIGYWNGSARPGDRGAVFLDGHADGVFADLDQISVGQMLYVTYAGNDYSYRVVYRETVPLDEVNMIKALRPYGDAAEGLNIMTCAGTFMSDRDTYDQRLTIYAVRV